MLPILRAPGSPNASGLTPAGNLSLDSQVDRQAWASKHVSLKPRRSRVDMKFEASSSRQIPTRLLCALAFTAALGLTMVMALLPQPPELPVALSDKVQHGAAFAVLAGLGAGAWPRRLTQIAIGLIILGGFIEILQMIPVLHRDAEFADWATDIAATLATLMVVRIVQRKRPPGTLDDDGDAAFEATPLA